jgi:DNA polymerase-3 subunit epsilon
MVPVDATNSSIEMPLAKHFFIKCPTYEELLPKLESWVAQHNKTLIRQASKEGIPLVKFKEEMISYLESPAIRNYFHKEKILILGKSLNAIDLPFLNRDLGWDFMRKYFSHRQLDVTSATLKAIDQKLLPSECISGSKLMNFFNMGSVAHTALEDAISTAQIYFKLLSLSPDKA